MWKACKSRFAEYIVKRLKSDIEFHNLNGIIIEESMCMWKCKEGPNVLFDKNLENYMTPIKASEIMRNKKNWKSKRTKKTNKK